MIASQLLQIRENQQASWNKFSPGWKKWDAFNMRFLQPMGEAIIDYLQIREDDVVLDIATGTGEPGLTIATLAKKGQVTGTDLAEDMLAIAAAHAAQKGIPNYATLQADTCELPFADNTFDAISCRMGFMFFPDMELAAREMLRVLRPGGKMATSVWGAPPKNGWIGTMMKAVSQHIELPPPIPGAPGMFRCAAPGTMTALLTQAGFKKVADKEITAKVTYESADQYWEMMMDVAAPVVAALSKVDEMTKSRVKTTLFGLLEEYAPTGSPLTLDYASTILYGEKE